MNQIARERPCKLGRWQILASALTLTAAGASQAAEWERSGGVSVGATYTDNVCLSRYDTEDEVVGILTPDIRLKGQGARSYFDLYAAVEFNTLDDPGEECDVRGAKNVSPAPRMRLSSTTELITNWAYLDLTGFADVNRADPFAVGGESTIDGRGNLNRTYRYSVAPYLNRRFGGSTEAFLQYRYSEFFNSVDTVEDREMQDVLFDIGTLPELARFSVGLTGDYSKIEYKEREGGGDFFNNELSSAKIRGAFNLDSEWQLNAYIGQEWNDFISYYDDIDGTVWDVGLRWTPNTRVMIEVGTGERFFGSTPRASISYRHKRSNLRFSYERELTYDSNVRTSDLLFENLQDILDNWTPGEDSIFLPDAFDTTVTNSPILDSRYMLVYSFKGRRTTLLLTGSYSEQRRMEDRYKDIFTDVGLSFRRRVSQRFSLLAGANWNRREPDEMRGIVNMDSDIYRYSAGIEYHLGPHTTFSLIYEYFERDSDSESEGSQYNEYEENQVTTRFDYRF
ncbi:MAG: TIGR03016 family PEP-CTERM system-associated outer membrane protein [Parahaliea sp.]